MGVVCYNTRMDSTTDNDMYLYIVFYTHDQVDDENDLIVHDACFTATCRTMAKRKFKRYYKFYTQAHNFKELEILQIKRLAKIS